MIVRFCLTGLILDGLTMQTVKMEISLVLKTLSKLYFFSSRRNAYVYQRIAWYILNHMFWLLHRKFGVYRQNASFSLPNIWLPQPKYLVAMSKKGKWSKKVATTKQSGFDNKKYTVDHISTKFMVPTTKPFSLCCNGSTSSWRERKFIRFWVGIGEELG